MDNSIKRIMALLAKVKEMNTLEELLDLAEDEYTPETNQIVRDSNFIHIDDLEDMVRESLSYYHIQDALRYIKNYLAGIVDFYGVNWYWHSPKGITNIPEDRAAEVAKELKVAFISDLTDELEELKAGSSPPDDRDTGDQDKWYADKVGKKRK